MRLLSKMWRRLIRKRSIYDTRGLLWAVMKADSVKPQEPRRNDASTVKTVNYRRDGVEYRA